MSTHLKRKVLVRHHNHGWKGERWFVFPILVAIDLHFLLVSTLDVGLFERLKNVITNAEQRLKAADPIRKHLHILFFQIGGHTKTALDELKNFQTVSPAGV
jgi:hypothetical protein